MWRKRTYDHSSLRNKVLEAFKILRKRGLMCRANFWCCGGCASYDMWSKMEKTNHIGGVFWHHQDEDNLKESPTGKGYLYLRYGANDNITERDSELADKWIGLMIYDALQEVGLHPVWNFSVGDCIRVCEEVEANQPIDIEACLVQTE